MKCPYVISVEAELKLISRFERRSDREHIHSDRSNAAQHNNIHNSSDHVYTLASPL
jgi:hypothetical protein